MNTRFVIFVFSHLWFTVVCLNYDSCGNNLGFSLIVTLYSVAALELFFTFALKRKINSKIWLI